MASSGAYTVSTKLQRIAQLARQLPGRVLTTLAHHIDVEFLRESFRRVRKDGAPGIDGVTAGAYERDLDQNLQNLLERFKAGSYRAPPVRRTYVPKDDGSQRPLGIPTFEDKILQQAVKMVLEAVYEQEFHDCSWGYRPGRSAKDALRVLWHGLQSMRTGWVLEVDIRSFFDHLDHSTLREILDQRVCDGVLRRSIDKWLKAGIFEDGVLRRPRGGTPQGGVVSPLLANVYLHAAIDLWFHDEIVPRLAGKALLVRYADDMVFAFERESDARRVLEVLPKRLARFKLTLHPEKTRLVPFSRPLPGTPGKGHNGWGMKPGTFGFLGFTHLWGRSRQGKWIVRQVTMVSRQRRTLRRLALWCRRNRHRPIAVQQEGLRRRLLGHYGYFLNPGNWRRVRAVFQDTRRIWRYWLSQRSQRSTVTWAKFLLLEKSYPLPQPRARHARP